MHVELYKHISLWYSKESQNVLHFTLGIAEGILNIHILFTNLNTSGKILQINFYRVKNDIYFTHRILCFCVKI